MQEPGCSSVLCFEVRYKCDGPKTALRVRNRCTNFSNTSYRIRQFYSTLDDLDVLAFLVHSSPTQVRNDLPRGEVNRVAISFGPTKPSAGKRWTECVTASATTK